MAVPFQDLSKRDMPTVGSDERFQGNAGYEIPPDKLELGDEVVRKADEFVLKCFQLFSLFFLSPGGRGPRRGGYIAPSPLSPPVKGGVKIT